MAATVRAVFPGTTTATVATSVTTVTTSVTMVSGDALMVHTTVSVGSDAGFSVTATANSVASDGASAIVHSNNQSAGFERIFYWVAPATGTYNVVSTVTGGTPDAIGQKCYAIAGSNASAPSFTSAVGEGTALSVTSATMPTGSVGISAFCIGSNISSTGQTTQLDQDIGGSSAAVAMAGASAAGSGGTTAFTATGGAVDWWAAIAAVWEQPGATDATVTFPQSIRIRPVGT